MRAKVEFIARDEAGVFPGLGPKNPQWGQKRSGVLVRGGHGVTVSVDDVNAFTRKLVLGLEYKFANGTPVPADIEIIPFQVSVEKWPELEGMVRTWKMDNAMSVPPAFLVFRQAAVDDPATTLWFFTIWNAIRLQAAAGRK